MSRPLYTREWVSSYCMGGRMGHRAGVDAPRFKPRTLQPPKTMRNVMKMLSGESVSQSRFELFTCRIQVRSVATWTYLVILFLAITGRNCMTTQPCYKNQDLCLRIRDFIQAWRQGTAVCKAQKEIVVWSICTHTFVIPAGESAFACFVVTSHPVWSTCWHTRTL
jgi:hypothetical protein